MEGVVAPDRKRKSHDTPAVTPNPKRPLKNTTNEDNAAAGKKKVPRKGTYKWVVGQKVKVRQFDNKWVEGTIEFISGPVTLAGVHCQYSIGVHVRNCDGNETLVPTWHEEALAIPHANGLIAKHLREYKENVESIPEGDKLYFNATKALLGKRRSSSGGRKEDMDLEQIPLSSFFDDALLGQSDDPECERLSLKQIMAQLKNSMDAKETIAAATGRKDPELTVPLLMSFYLGKLSGCELQRLSSSRDDRKCFSFEWFLCHHVLNMPELYPCSFLCTFRGKIDWRANTRRVDRRQ